MALPTTLTDEQLAWAFGPGWESMSLGQAMDAWNRRHAELFTILDHDSPLQVEPRIKDAFFKQQETTQ